MTTSPSETIAKAMEGDMSAPLNAVDRLRMLAGGVNTHNLDMDDAEWILDALNTLLPLALQLEAMKREMAEKDAERRMIVSHATMGGTDGEGMSVNAVSVEITRLRNQLIEDTRARTLIQGEKQ